MPTLLTRTTLSPGSEVTVPTEGSANISVFCHTGQVAVEAYGDVAAPNGYNFVVKGSAATVPSAAQLVILATGAVDAEIEVHAP